MNEFDEERERALAYREQEIAREKDKVARNRALTGNAERYNELLAKTSALRHWQGWTNEKLIDDPEF